MKEKLLHLLEKYAENLIYSQFGSYYQCEIYDIRIKIYKKFDFKRFKNSFTIEVPYAAKYEITKQQYKDILNTREIKNEFRNLEYKKLIRERSNKLC